MIQRNEVRVFCWEGEEWEEPLLRIAARMGIPNPSLQRLPGGKPVFCPSCGLHFSVSNTAGVQAVAVAFFPVGIDLERTGRRASFLQIAEKYFFPEEKEWLLEVPEKSEARAVRFFKLWTAKEAVVKLDGIGLYGGGLCGARTFQTGESLHSAQLLGRNATLQSRVYSSDFLVTVAAFQDFLLALDGEFPKVH